jgi:hypothetical protein
VRSLELIGSTPFWKVDLPPHPKGPFSHRERRGASDSKPLSLDGIGVGVRVFLPKWLVTFTLIRVA